MSKTLVVLLLFNLTSFTIHPDLKRQQSNFSKNVKNDSFTLKAPYQAKNINTTRDNDTYNKKWFVNVGEDGFGRIYLSK